MVLGVDWPPPTGTETTIGENVTLGVTCMVDNPVLDTFTLDTGIAVVVRTGMVTVIVTVEVTHIDPSMWPTSTDVVYGGGEIVVVEPEGKLTGGKTKTHGGVHCAVFVL